MRMLCMMLGNTNQTNNSDFVPYHQQHFGNISSMSTATFKMYFQL